MKHTIHHRRWQTSKKRHHSAKIGNLNKKNLFLTKTSLNFWWRSLNTKLAGRREQNHEVSRCLRRREINLVYDCLVFILFSKNNHCGKFGTENFTIQFMIYELFVFVTFLISNQTGQHKKCNQCWNFNRERLFNSHKLNKIWPKN